MSGMLNRNILRALYRANFEKIITYGGYIIMGVEDDGTPICCKAYIR